MRLPLIAALCFAALPAQADFASSCVGAIEEGDDSKAAMFSRMLLARPRQLDKVGQANGLRCIEHATGIAHKYDRDLGRFYSPDQQAEIDAEKAQIEGQKAAEVAAAKAEAEAKAADDKAWAQIEADAAKAKFDRESAVLARLDEGCANMYQRDPDATITNPLCFDVFFRTGLPR